MTVGRLAGALARLSKGERDVVLLIAYGGLRYDEVAAALSIASGTVASRLSRARTKLREVLG
ncbi:sigma factor-like helix-turn-helix DNA-binding protein [Nonomuraea sp. NPDC048881]|uniref:RNA polymerase sigma factor n=1 Tax=Nonomuraea sp. NPDC048881 TaxID=3155030 RepID=UPI0033CF6B53